MQCIFMFRKGKFEPGLNLENQECHWKEELLSVEIGIKITGSDARFGNDKQNKYGTKP